MRRWFHVVVVAISCATGCAQVGHESDTLGRTPLMLAAGSSQPDSDIRALLKAGADVNAKDNRGFTALMYATISSWRHAHGSMRKPEDTLQRLRLLIDAGADVNARASGGETALMTAAGADSYAALPDGAACSLLLEKGAELEARDSQGLTPLMYAARRGPSSIAALLRAGADINARDNEGRTPLMVVFTGEWWPGGDPDSVKALLKGDPDLELADGKGWTALAYAAQLGRTRYPAGEILDAGADLGPLGWTELHAAALRRDAARVQSLLRDRADPNARDRWQRTPLMWAARFIDNDRETIPALIRAGVDVNAVDETGATALHIAVSHAWDGEAYGLLAGGAQIEARDPEGRTPLMYAAAARSHQFQVEYLLKNGADVNAIDGEGRTALVHAVIAPDSEGRAVPFLLKGGADKGIRDKSGRTALDYANEGLRGRMPAERRELLQQLR